MDRETELKMRPTSYDRSPMHGHPIGESGHGPGTSGIQGTPQLKISVYTEEKNMITRSYPVSVQQKQKLRKEN